MATTGTPAETIELASKVYEQSHTLTARWVPGHRRVSSNEVADTYAREAAEGRTPDAASRQADAKTR